MKFAYAWILLLCFSIGLCAGATVQKGESEEVKPFGQASDIRQDLKALIKGAEFQAFLRVLQSNEVKTTLQSLLSHLEVLKLHQRIIQHISASHGKFEVEEINVNLINPKPVARSGFLDDLLSLLPLGDFISMLNEKLQDSPELIEFWKEIGYPLKNVIESPVFQKLADDLKAQGFDVDHLLQTVLDIFGWN